MPTYEYECESCGLQFEYLQSMSEPPKEKCEKCGGHLKKLLSAGSGLIFKGSGFYITDYKGGTKSGETSKSEGGEAKKEAKPAAEKKESGGGGKSGGTDSKGTSGSKGD